MELLREWQPEPAVPPEALMDWVEDEAAPVVLLEVARVEAQLPVVHLVLARLLVAARVEAQPPVVHLELARAEAWGPTYRVIRK